ncbi:MAG: PHB depolymerase family esterase [Dehalococcoidia bacterium]
MGTAGKLVLAAIVLAVLAYFVPSLGIASAAPGASGCTPDRTHAAGDFTQTIDSGGVARQFRLHVPPSYDGTARVPLVLLFHGAGSTDDGISTYTGFPDKADEAGFIAVMPLGTVPQGLPLGRIFDHLTFIPGMPDDVAFVDDLLDKLEAQLCIDPRRVYSTGFSNGGMFSVRLACDLGDRFAAIAPVAGVYYPPFAWQLADVEPGCPSGPIPMLAIHGTNDQSVFFEGGPVFGSKALTIKPIETYVLPDWAAHNHCAGTPEQQPVTDHVRLVRYGGCEDDAIVQLYVIEGGMHVWPGALDLPAPDVNDDIDANDLIWDFFERHPKPIAQPSVAQATPTPRPTAAVSGLPSTGVQAEHDGRLAVTVLLLALATVAITSGIWYTMRTRKREGKRR